MSEDAEYLATVLETYGQHPAVTALEALSTTDQTMVLHALIGAAWHEDWYEPMMEILGRMCRHISA